MIKIAARKEFESKELWEMHRLRTKISRENGLGCSRYERDEIDGYDALDLTT